MAANSFEIKEYFDMILLYGEARRNSRLAAELYQIRFPNRYLINYVKAMELLFFLRTEGNPVTGRFTEPR